MRAQTLESWCSELAGVGAVAQRVALGVGGRHLLHGHGLAVLARGPAVPQAASQQAPAVHQIQRECQEHQPCTPCMNYFNRGTIGSSRPPPARPRSSSDSAQTPGTPALHARFETFSKSPVEFVQPIITLPPRRRAAVSLWAETCLKHPAFRHTRAAMPGYQAWFMLSSA